MDFTIFHWTREPDLHRINKDSIEIITLHVYNTIKKETNRKLPLY